MSYTVGWDPEALDAATGYLNDPVGLAAVFDAADSLAGSPRPAGALAMGPHRCRVRLGRYRLYYDIDEDARSITIIRCGRVT